MKIRTLLLCLPLLFTSCAIYRQKFDCPPDPGVPCTSVSDLERMIIETESGPDIFVGEDTQGTTSECDKKAQRVWIRKPCGRGCYIYFNGRKNA